MEPFSQFDIDKRRAIAALQELQALLAELGETGVEVQADLDKVAAALRAVDEDVLRIALLGAFSDGKTSVIAAWLGQVMADMKIDMDESSDRLAIYQPQGLPGRCEIVDTPGLFGDKAREIDGRAVMYEDLTKRYISEAHLILYVVDATNPLKDSHGDIARWILRDLNKLSSTVFVINKMDEVTELTDAVLFDEQAAIKTANLKGKLQRLAHLSPEELAQLHVVCIAANPNGRGLPFWFDKLPTYESRSRIGELKRQTQQVLQANVPAVLRAKTGLDVVRDLVGRKLAQADAELRELAAYEQLNREESERIREDLAQGRAEVKRLAGELVRELMALEKRLLGRLRPLSLEDLQAFVDEEIGHSEDDVGYKLRLQIKGAVDRFFDQSSAVTRRISLDIERQLDVGESFLEAMGQKGVRAVSGALKGVSQLNPALIKQSIFAARDVLAKVTGLVIKFKPWEASKLAGAISKWSGPVGLLIQLGADGYQSYKAHEQEQRLAQIKLSFTELIRGAFKDLYDLLGDDAKMFEFFAPGLKPLEQIVQRMGESAAQIRQSTDRVQALQQRLSRLALPEGAPSELDPRP
ncbi:dynamin family protein [Pelomonas sp. CA6]|uniref:LeoA/HP0731 family dynamin-like GTPase n=1 Tax=Pelomonas sp. CA6 TaxID=2907999 RepID=UPI001F4B0977|nr:LeoA/HP0731 family dynamin-like GTPase [Pelomonas sp. CA6]MCH7342002.1 dynamin family protein [Pelomonas sp. CA6]